MSWGTGGRHETISLIDTSKHTTQSFPRPSLKQILAIGMLFMHCKRFSENPAFDLAWKPTKECLGDSTCTPQPSSPETGTTSRCKQTPHYSLTHVLISPDLGQLRKFGD